MVDNDPFGELAGLEEEAHQGPQSVEAQLAAQLSSRDPNSFRFEFCGKELECGCTCSGVSGESLCLPCFKNNCPGVAQGANMDSMEP